MKSKLFTALLILNLLMSTIAVAILIRNIIVIKKFYVFVDDQTKSLTEVVNIMIQWELMDAEETQE